LTSSAERKAEVASAIALEGERVVQDLTGSRSARVLSVLKHGKSKVLLVEPEGGELPLVAKLAAHDTIANESRILGMLEAAPVRSLRAYGVVPSSIAGKSWMVSEYAVGPSFDRRSHDHRCVAAGWLARVHLWSHATGPLLLTDRGVAYHQGVVRQARSTLLSALEALSVQGADKMRLQRLVVLTDQLLGRWDEVAHAIGQLPPVLVHSGFAHKNVVIGIEGGISVVLAFDWEQGGWGSGVADLSMVDVDTYISLVREDWPLVQPAQIRRAALLGRVLWCLAPIPGERVNLVSPWPDRALAKMAYYLEWSEQALDELRAAGWPS
jgi:hypothetical protein